MFYMRVINMRKITAFILAGLLFGNTAFADDCSEPLTGLFTGFQATKLCKSFGSAVNNSLVPSADNTYDVGSSSLGWRSGYFDTSVLSPLIIAPGDLTVRVDADAQRLYTIGASSDTALTTTFGDGGTTAAQVWNISGSTSDGDDDSTLCVGGGGACKTAGRGGFLNVEGADVGGAGAGDTILGSSDTLFFQTGSGLTTAMTINASQAVTIGNGTLTVAGAIIPQNNITFSTAGTYVRAAPYVPTMAATAVAGTNAFAPGLNVVPTAAANTAAMTAATPNVGDRYIVYNNNSANAVRFKAGGATTINGSAAGAYVELAAAAAIQCDVVTGTNMVCTSLTTTAMATPAGP